MHGVFSFIFRRFDRLRSGGDDGIRTHDPLLAGQVLSQLSYTPSFLSGSGHQKLNNKYFPFPSYSTRSPVSFFCSTFDY